MNFYQFRKQLKAFPVLKLLKLKKKNWIKNFKLKSFSMLPYPTTAWVLLKKHTRVYGHRVLDLVHVRTR